MMRLAVLLLPLLPIAALADEAAASSLRLFADGKKPADRRLTTIRTLNDKDFYFRPPTTLAAWQVRRQQVREQILVATGLWPLPPRTPLAPVIHGRIDREGYSVEKVFFASLPGHYVSGSLYRPRDKDGKLPPGKLPGVLCPHGHWRNGRFYDAGEKAANAQIAIKAESTLAGGRHPLQARCAQLARMGCVVFHYDMVGYADSAPIAHHFGGDTESELRLQNRMGLQTWNSIRSLDFLAGLEEVDGKRLGVTGASGGGTQTFILCAIDDRPAAAFPAVMVGTQMQGGCDCENAPYLRIGTGNVEMAAVFAPKPLALSGANDWTREIENKGLPELKAIYKLHGQPDHVAARCWPEYDHNYNQPAREMMYDWMNRNLKLGHKSPIVEQPFEPIPPAQLSVFTNEHPRPKDARDADRLREYLTETSDKQIQALLPTNAEGLAAYRKVFGPALRVMLDGGVPEARDVESRPQGEPKIDGAMVRGLVIGRRGQGEQVPALLLRSPQENARKNKDTVVVWVHPEGKASVARDGKLVPEAKMLLDSGATILALDVFGTGELALEKPINAVFRYTGYNRPLPAQQAHDILTAVAVARSQKGTRSVHLFGQGKLGPVTLLARGVCGDAVARTAVDADQFRFEKVRKLTDEMLLPGALKYGGLGALGALSAPAEVLIHNHQGTGIGKWTKAVYEAAGSKDKLHTPNARLASEKVVEWLLR